MGCLLQFKVFCAISEQRPNNIRLIYPAIISERWSRSNAKGVPAIRRQPAAARCARDSLCLPRSCPADSGGNAAAALVRPFVGVNRPELVPRRSGSRLCHATHSFLPREAATASLRLAVAADRRTTAVPASSPTHPGKIELC